MILSTENSQERGFWWVHFAPLEEPLQKSTHIITEKKVSHSLPVNSIFTIIMHYLEVLVEVLVELEDGRHIPTPVAVIRRRPNSHETLGSDLSAVVLLREHGLVALHHKLVGSRDEVDVVDLVELGDHVRSEQIARATRRESPPFYVLRIRPHEIAHGTVMRNFLLSVNRTNLMRFK